VPSISARPWLGLVLALALPPATAAAQFFSPDQPDRSVTPVERAELIAALSKALEAKYVFPEVATRMAKLLTDRQTAGAYGTTSAKELSTILSADLLQVAHDKHLRVFYSAEPLPAGGAGPQGPPPRAAFAARNFGFTKVERLKGNVGYLKFDGFMDPGSGAGDVAAGAMAFLSGTDALIIDLRENGGGSPAMVAFLCTYLFDGRPVHLNDLYWRTSGETQQWWTLPFVPGSRYVDKEVYLLTSSKTFSAAEEFTYNLKTQKRATLVGETTGGGANPGGIERLTAHFAAFVPAGRAINPITKTNWEGTGVAPDLQASAEQALDVAYRAALTKLAGTSRGPMLDRETKEALDRRPTP
jgi:hypothetical protein